jgi:hypothetical protein
MVQEKQVGLKLKWTHQLLIYDEDDAIYWVIM